MKIIALNEIEHRLEDLCLLLCDCVDRGASIGFLPPLEQNKARNYWLSLSESLKNSTRHLMVLLEDEQIVGSVQLALCQKENGLHRADLEKLIVHSAWRGRGLGRRLLTEAEKLAVSLGRTMLILDTRKGDIASKMYLKYGYTPVGEIPDFVVESNGGWSATVYFYKSLTAERDESAKAIVV